MMRVWHLYVCLTSVCRVYRA